MKNKYFCPIFQREIDNGKCLDINFEIEKIKKPEEIILIKRILGFNESKIKCICMSCKNYPM
ncbi:hypothetical protein DEHRE_02270 [Dehalobacter restrictus DSM 9455]|jgi:hypothetical protein|uniref:Uncharacterized protein n=1 Tax=Dehalobacter restrictus (strain DSM 9455 / PER-K23) TaxID=871738 RepID=A0ABM5P8X1_DEHRP|nr:hypothetical protein DEHRE_02270 [Dehalobacter restrictus DSM 9455]